MCASVSLSGEATVDETIKKCNETDREKLTSARVATPAESMNAIDVQSMMTVCKKDLQDASPCKWCSHFKAAIFFAHSTWHIWCRGHLVICSWGSLASDSLHWAFVSRSLRQFFTQIFAPFAAFSSQLVSSSVCFSWDTFIFLHRSTGWLFDSIFSFFRWLQSLWHLTASLFLLEHPEVNLMTCFLKVSRFRKKRGDENCRIRMPDNSWFGGERGHRLISDCWWVLSACEQINKKYRWDRHCARLESTSVECATVINCVPGDESIKRPEDKLTVCYIWNEYSRVIRCAEWRLKIFQYH